ncbi:MAG: hypothetical protein FJ398_09235 [Verrucomicrobia bacterium]|nr:hypothetical protein [Verrucomicrobiota bacterium]
MGHVQGSKAVGASHEPDGRASLSQRAASDVFHARRAARRDGLALPGSWGESMVIGPRKLSVN